MGSRLRERDGLDKAVPASPATPSPSDAALAAYRRRTRRARCPRRAFPPCGAARSRLRTRSHARSPGGRHRSGGGGGPHRPRPPPAGRQPRRFPARWRSCWAAISVPPASDAPAALHPACSACHRAASSPLIRSLRAACEWAEAGQRVQGRQARSTRTGSTAAGARPWLRSRPPTRQRINAETGPRIRAAARSSSGWPRPSSGRPNAIPPLPLSEHRRRGFPRRRRAALQPAARGRPAPPQRHAHGGCRPLLEREGARALHARSRGVLPLHHLGGGRGGQDRGRHSSRPSRACCGMRSACSIHAARDQPSPASP